jgi:hypothetical protein
MATGHGTPITITLYDADDNVAGVYTRLIIPWGLLKRVLRFYKSVKLDDLTEADLDELAALVVEIFGGKFSVDELNTGADTGDMVAVITQLIAKTRGLTPNPPPPAG